MRDRAGVREICFGSLIVLTLLLPAVPAWAQTTKVYTVDRASNQLREINPLTGATIRSVEITVPSISPQPLIPGATGLATDPTTSKLYALLLHDNAPHLATIDPNTGFATPIGSLLTRSYAGLTFSRTGKLYAITDDGSTNPETLYELDKSTAALPTLVAVLGNGNKGEAIAFNSDNDRIYHMSGENPQGTLPPPATMVLETIDPASPGTPPVNIPIGATFPISEATAMVYQGSGTGTFLWIDIFGATLPPNTSRLLTMTTGGVPAFRGSLTYTATGIAIVPVFTLTVNLSKTGSATGTVTIAPLGGTCGPVAQACLTPIVGGSRVTLTAAPGSNSQFNGWTGVCTGTATTCVVDMNVDKSVTATFAPVTVLHTLTVTRNGAGTGTVTSNPVGIDCGTTCSASFAQGTSVVLTATASPGSTFASWSGGGCSGSSLMCSVPMSGVQAVSATFYAGSRGFLFANRPATTSVTLTDFNPLKVATYAVSVNGTGGFSGDITLGCLDTPLPPNAHATCPAGQTMTLTPDPSTGLSFGTATVTVRVKLDNAALSWPLEWPLFPLIASFMALLAATFGALPHRLRARLRVAMAGGAIVVVALGADCTTGITGTDRRDYEVFITADEANPSQPSQPIRRSQAVTLTVFRE